MPTNAIRIKQHGDALYVTGTDGTTTLFAPTVSGYFVPTIASGYTPPPQTPPPPPPDGSPTNQQALVNWMTAHLQMYPYSQASGRLQPDVSGYTDCSGLVWYCYQQVLGVNVGTWTGDQQNYGTQIYYTTSNTIDESIMALGDLVFFDYNSYTSSYDHVEMYIGNNEICGTGGPTGVPGPTIKNFENNVAYANRVEVRRYI